MNTSACYSSDMTMISPYYHSNIPTVLILSYIKEIGELILVVWGMFLLPTVGIPLLETIGGAESVSYILVLVLCLWVNGYVTLVAIVMIVHILLSGGVTTGRLLNTIYLMVGISVYSSAICVTPSSQLPS